MGKVALPNEIPGESVILFPYREAGQPVRVYAIILAVDLLDQREGTPRLGPAAVKGKDYLLWQKSKQRAATAWVISPRNLRN